MPESNPNSNPNPNPNPAPAPTPGETLLSTVPESYKDKDWVKQNTKDPESFFKFVDNLNTTVGKKGVILPGENATPEEMNSFYKALGRPDKAEEYEFGNIEELKDVKRIEERDLEVKKLFHDIGVPKGMAKKIQTGFEKLIFGEHQKIQAANAQQDKEFNDAVTKMFGDKKDIALAESKKFLKEHAPKEALAKLDALDNDSLLILTATLDNIVKKYVKEDGFVGGGSGAAPAGGETYEQVSAQQRELMKNPAFMDFRHADHQKVMDANNALLAKMRALQLKK